MGYKEEILKKIESLREYERQRLSKITPKRLMRWNH